MPGSAGALMLPVRPLRPSYPNGRFVLNSASKVLSDGLRALGLETPLPSAALARSDINDPCHMAALLALAFQSAQPVQLRPCFALPGPYGEGILAALRATIDHIDASAAAWRP